jgi:hypothetical protein
MKKRSTFAPAFENNNVLWQTSKAVQLRVSEKNIFWKQRIEHSTFAAPNQKVKREKLKSSLI